LTLQNHEVRDFLEVNRMRTRLLAAAFCCLVLAPVSLPPAVAQSPALTIESAAIVPEVRAGDERKMPWFGCVLVEFRGHLKVADAPREFDFMPILQPPQELPALDERHLHDVCGVGIGVIDDAGKVIYPCLARRVEKKSFSAKRPDGAGLEVRFAGGGNRQVKVLTAETPVAMAFYVPIKQPELKLTVHFAYGQNIVQAAAPPLSITTKDLGWPIPDNKQKDAKAAFALNLPFFIWTEKPAVKASEDYLRFAVNPALALADVPALANVATRSQMTINQPGASNTPFTSTANEQFGIRWMPGQFRGRGKAVLTIVKRSDDPKNAEQAPALSNKLGMQVSFDPPKAAKPSKGGPADKDKDKDKDKDAQRPPKKGRFWTNVNDIDVTGEKRRAGKRFAIWPTSDERVTIEGGKLTLQLRWQVGDDQAAPGDPKQDAVNLSLFIVSKTARLFRGQAVKLEVGSTEGEVEWTETFDGDLRGADVYAYFSHDTIDKAKAKLVNTPLSNIIRIKTVVK
jgi:hypothetical protein